MLELESWPDSSTRNEAVSTTSLPSPSLSLSPSNFRHYPRGDCSTIKVDQRRMNRSTLDEHTWSGGKEQASLMKDQLKAYHASKYRGLVPRIPTRSSRSWEWKRFTRHRGVKRSPFLVVVDGYAGVYKFGSSPRFKFNEKAHGSSVAQKLSRACHVCIFHPPW